MGPAKKPTGFLTNSAHIPEELNHRCPGDHIHIPLMGGRAAEAAIYPDKLCEAVCRGLKAHKESLRTGKVATLPMDKNRLRGIGVLCEEAAIASRTNPREDKTTRRYIYFSFPNYILYFFTYPTIPMCIKH